MATSFNFNPNFGKHLWIMVDGHGQPVAGTDVWRKKKPASGRWKQVDIDSCCSGAVLTLTPGDVSLTDPTLTVLCDDTSIVVVNVVGTSTDIDSLVALLNSQASYVGAFDADGDDITLRLKQAVGDAIDCTGTLSFTVA